MARSDEFQLKDPGEDFNPAAAIVSLATMMQPADFRKLFLMLPLMVQSRGSEAAVQLIYHLCMVIVSKSDTGCSTGGVIGGKSGVIAFAASEKISFREIGEAILNACEHDEAEVKALADHFALPTARDEKKS